jgi:hypothetical protein
MAALRQKRPFLPFENAAACPEWFAQTVLEYFDPTQRIGSARMPASFVI